MGRPSMRMFGLRIAAPASRRRSASVAPSGSVKVCEPASGRSNVTSAHRLVVEAVLIPNSLISGSRDGPCPYLVSDHYTGPRPRRPMGPTSREASLDPPDADPASLAVALCQDPLIGIPSNVVGLLRGILV